MQAAQQLTARQTEIVTAARQWIGTPYHHQAAVRGVGCDCLGLIRGVYAQVTGREAETPPPYSHDWAEASGEELLLAACARSLIPRVEQQDIEPGDVLIFRIHERSAAKHAAIWTGEAMIHAQRGIAVSETCMGGWWVSRIVAVYGFPGRGVQGEDR
jgi:NlpC/P60 family putative phage cell wall peptidase